ncbi:MAG: ATP-binding protein [Elusimicrobia bacterium]|nr:ATP-binding protein [Elusimicrobiota bacterium]
MPRTLYIREPLFDTLWNALSGDPNLLQVVTGPRQVGKTTIALQVHERWRGQKVYESADQPYTPDAEWISTHWKNARHLPLKAGEGTLLILDEVQKIPRWSEVVKVLVDEDRRARARLRVLLLGSSALLVQRGLTESLAGRFELHRHMQWSFKECRECFGLGLNDFLVFGGYPGALALRKDPVRWSRFVRDSLIETVIGKDVLLMSPVQKPALLRQAFGMACAHPAEIMSYQKMLGQLADAGNTVTIAHYFQLLAAAYLMSPLQRWSGSRIRQRGSIPKIILRDNSLVTALAPGAMKDGKLDAAWRGRLVENAVGAALLASAESEGSEVFYWRDRKDEVDFVLRRGEELVGIEVKSGQQASALAGAAQFKRRFPKSRLVVIGEVNTGGDYEQVSLEIFFARGSA